jgi:hypothetical protein
VSAKDVICTIAKEIGPENRSEIFRRVSAQFPECSYSYMCNVIRKHFASDLGPAKIGRPRRVSVDILTIETDKSLRSKLDKIVETRKFGCSHEEVVKQLIRKCAV